MSIHREEVYLRERPITQECCPRKPHKVGGNRGNRIMLPELTLSDMESVVDKWFIHPGPLLGGTVEHLPWWANYE